jgi:hypothetical protein
LIVVYSVPQANRRLEEIKESGEFLGPLSVLNDRGRSE